MAERKATYRNPRELTPEICMTRWRYGYISGRDQAWRPERVQDTLVVERTPPDELGTLLVMPLPLFVFGMFVLFEIYSFDSVQNILFSVFLILFALYPIVISIIIGVGVVSTLYYNSRFIPPYLTFDCASLVPGSAVMVQYRHPQKNARRTIHGFVLTELVTATHTHLPGTSPDGPATDTHYQILWSSGVRTHTIAPNTAGMTFEQVIEIPEGFPDTGPLPIEGKELKKEAVWYVRVYEVTLPRASCEYEFILPVGGAQPEPPDPSQASQSLRSISTGQGL